MQYTKYLITIGGLSLVSLYALASAATGEVVVSTGVTTGSTMATSTGVDVKSALRLVKKTSDSIVLEWDKITSASAYIVKYSKNSVANSQDPNAIYDYETDSISTTGAVITSLSSVKEKLSAGTPYYFSVVIIDKEGKESENYLTDELMVTTESATSVPATTTTTTGLAIKDFTITDDKTLSLSFSKNLSTEPVRVKITKTSDNSAVVVGTIVQDPKNLNAVTITTLTALTPSSAYTLTVLAAKDVDGNTVQEGVNGLKEFTTSDALKSSISMEAAPTVDSINTLSAPTANTGSKMNTGVLSAESAIKVATGTQENMIVLAALLLSLGIVAIYRRKLM